MRSLIIIYNVQCTMHRMRLKSDIVHREWERFLQLLNSEALNPLYFTNELVEIRQISGQEKSQIVIP